MTLKFNKNEPALILESVNSARTALSDLYLEQLLQNKPKSDKVLCRFYLFFFFFFSLPPAFWCRCLLPGSRDGAHDCCLFLDKMSKNRANWVFPVQQSAAEFVGLSNKAVDT